MLLNFLDPSTYPDILSDIQNRKLEPLYKLMDLDDLFGGNDLRNNIRVVISGIMKW
jgi:hypothetical protein